MTSPESTPLVVEDVIEPELPVVDAHHHLWPGWRRPYLLFEILGDAEGMNLRQTVFIECSTGYYADGPEEFKPVGETEFVQGIAAWSASGQHAGETRIAAGIVGTANLRLGDAVSPVLEAHITRSPARFRGIRDRAAWAGPDSPTPQHLLMDRDFRKGFARLRPYALTFDAWVFHTQIPEVSDLARAFPDTGIVLNHFGGPLFNTLSESDRADAHAEWKKDIGELAACQNVMIKLGGLGMETVGYGWEDDPPGSDRLAEATREWVFYAVEQFGPDRCMFESNFPVDKASFSYSVMWNSFKKITRDFSSDERAALFHDTAVRFYRLSGSLRERVD